MITRTNESKTLTKSVNGDLMDEKLIHANGGIMINTNVSVKNVKYVKKIMLEILLHVVVKMDNIKKVLRMIQ